MKESDIVYNNFESQIKRKIDAVKAYIQFKFKFVHWDR